MIAIGRPRGYGRGARGVSRSLARSRHLRQRDTGWRSHCQGGAALRRQAKPDGHSAAEDGGARLLTSRGSGPFRAAGKKAARRRCREGPSLVRSPVRRTRGQLRVERATLRRFAIAWGNSGFWLGSLLLRCRGADSQTDTAAENSRKFPFCSKQRGSLSVEEDGCSNLPRNAAAVPWPRRAREWPNGPTENGNGAHKRHYPTSSCSSPRASG